MNNTNIKFILNIMSIAIMIYGIAMLPSLFFAIRYHEVGVYFTMSIISILCISLGLIGHRIMDNNLTNVKIRVCYMTTVLTWLLLILLSALPYFTAGMNYSFVDCIFESTASWTTTGASAIATSTLPIGLKLWRASCNWMGGIGIILLTLTFLPSWQFVGQKLATTEIRGPRFLMSTTTFRKAYRRILFFYVGITLLHFVALRLTGMPQLNSLLTALSNSSTSGLQHINNGVITALPVSTKVVITIFAFIGSTNVSIFVMIFSKQIKKLLKNSELKMYLLIIAVSTILLTISITISEKAHDILSVAGNTFMQVISFTSTAGYIVTKCDHWNSFNLFLIFVLMFIGACAISTGGGIKVSRLVYMLKSLKITIYNQLHPHSIQSINYNGEPSKSENITRSNMYIAIFMIIFIIGGILITADGTDAYTSLSYSAAMITNGGSPISHLANPGLVAHMSTYSKYIMSVLMLCGRLEIYPVLMLMSSTLWNSNISSRVPVQ